MATVIDALVVTLGLDPKAFKSGSAEVNESLKKTSAESARTAREMEERGKQAAQFFSKVRNEALALLAVFTAGMGLKAFVSDTISSSASLSRMSDNLNMSAKDLAEWQLAAKNAGGSAEGITNQLKESADQVAKYRRGMATETTPAFFTFGGKTEDLKDGNAYLLARARIVAEIYKTDRSRAALAANMMGLDAQQFNLYKEGPDGIDRRRREQSGPAAELAAAAKRAEQLRQKYDTAMNKLSSVGVNVLTALMPAFDHIVGKLTDFGNWIIANKSQVNAALMAVADGIKAIFEAMSEVFNKLVPKSVRDKISKADDPVKASMDAAKDAISPSWMKGKSEGSGPGSGMRYDDPKLNNYATEVEQKNGLPNGLLNAIKNKGERSNSDQVSPAGAKGVMQFMPGTWSQYGKGEITNPYDSIDAAGRYFNDMMKRYGGNVDAAITEYNGGIKQARAVEGGGKPTAAETVNYLARVRAGLDDDVQNNAGNKLFGEYQRLAKLAQGAHPVAAKDKTPVLASPGAIGTVPGLSDADFRAAMSAGAAAAVATSEQAFNTINNNSTATTTTTHTSSNETNIHGPINIQSAATDGQGIALAIAGLSQSQTLAAQSNTGLF